ncbi:bifunctional proline dehydrogenase/L-glutamate gamma-semialdehyde dehydrogenase [Bacteriovorax sp. PP10]|uniref:L-glutamate gamma-semialdehyde dehydrogenase n=1 Tax=Bacteriovorax antarcticus TaxID=3088717 RepID=A0ABU5VTY9_9BACT|nr:bifunctional proline dehydrogenase/L-glutamate gamma-semialdehyde dehydrogenase [Bacteriovorax sp. PP10]MEA9356514.1 bifunctional proline dehydrogenase/L-glutamate gamma-semialdehyde dehydrogenase [Bacteriovorax sp. PP10]
MTIRKVNHHDWSFFFYEEFADTFMGSDDVIHADVLAELKPFMENLTNNFRTQMVFRSVPFLVGFYFNKKEVRFYTPKLSQELFLLQQSEILDLNIPQVKDLRAHAEMAASLQVKNFPTVIEDLIRVDGLPDLLKDPKYQAIEVRSAEIVKKLLSFLNEYRPTLFEDVSDFGLGLTAQYALLRIHLLKFLAILPSLDHDKKGSEVKRILIEALSRFLKDNRKARRAKKRGQDRALPRTYTLGIKAIFYLAKVIPAWPLATMVRNAVKLMAKRFIAGESIEKADRSLRALYDTKRDVTLDQLGELVVSEKEADHYKDEVLKLVRGFSLHVKKGELNVAGINRAHVSIKVSALCSDFKPQAFDYTYNLVGPRLKEILITAKEEDVFINIDAEHYHYRDVVFKIYRRVLLETQELRDYQSTGIVIQAYLRDGAKHLKDIVELAKERNLPMPVRLVKGAYWDAETVEGDAHSFNAPQFLNKEETDIHFRQLIMKILEAHPHLKLALASHNFSDHGFAEAAKELFYPDVGEIEHQCLHMTYEALSTALAKMGWATRNYVPVGSLLVGMAYLVRRIMENSSQVGVLTIMRSHKKHLTLQSPYAIHEEKKKEGKIVRDQSVSKLEDEFFNVSPLRLYLDNERQWMEKALTTFEMKSLGIDYINAQDLMGDWVSINASSDPKVLVGRIRFANLQDASIALDTIDKSYNEGTWANSKWPFRTATLVKAASLMLAKRNELSALIVYEAGKSVSEALADVDEAIDFLNFYARTEAFLQRNQTDLTGRGPTVVISPWNFPIAIPCGMVVSSLVCGNTVILKSAEQTPLVTQLLVDMLHASGVPKDVLIHLPGEGETVGDYLVKDPRTSTIVFTGSKAVGTHIGSIARKRLYKNKLSGKTYPVKAITEMGGKNAVIVTQNAELDETVSGILYSAFGHAGQKCSACSRVIVHNSLKDKLIERLRAAATDLKVGESYKFDTTVNPVITADDQKRLRQAAREASNEAINFGGQVVIDRSNEALPGYCVGPVIIELPYSRALDKDSFAQRELFGPVVHIMGFETLDDAARLFNSTDYALTGGIFSQSQNDIDYLLTKIESGNVYINRTITGARVAIEPFGGFKLSGTGPKAGGRHFILALHQTKEMLPSESNEGRFVVEEGHDSPVILKRPSKLVAQSRVDRMEKFLDQFITSFETHYQGIFSNYKDSLRDYRKWLSKNFVNFVEKEHKNRVIPGQLSYNDYNLTAEHALVVSITDRPQLKTLIQVFSCLAAGTGLSVVCRNNRSFQWWMNLRDTLFAAGFSKENLEVYFTKTSELANVINDPKLSVIIYDGLMEEYSAHVGDFLNDGKTDQRMKLILTVNDNLKAQDFYHQALNYVWVRSLAVNTMRHGAPLDLEI